MPKRSFSSRAKAGLVSALDAAARAGGHQIVRRNFYTPLPDLSALPDDLWPGPQETPGVDLNLSAARELISKHLAPFAAEFAPPRKPDGQRFYLENSTYGVGDADVLYAMVRYLKPHRVVELGSGASSHVIDAARARNAADGRSSEHAIFDPYPFTASGLPPLAEIELHETRSEYLEVEELGALVPGDIVFVDTTHTVKTGGDVTNIFLRLIPRIASGVFVHVHDIFMPFEYPREWVVDLRRAWAEQYLLQAFLAFNRDFEVVVPLHALSRLHHQELAESIPSLGETDMPGAFWFRRV